MKLTISALAFTATSSPQYDLTQVLQNLNDLNEWAAEQSIARNDVGAAITEDMQMWQENFMSTVQYGATRREVRELEQFGRRLLFDQMSSYATTRGSFDTNGIDLKKLSGYGCYGSPLDKKDPNWVGKGKPVDAIDELNFKLHNCYRCLQKDFDKQCDGSMPYKSVSRNNNIICRDGENTCKRSTCECDRAYVLALREIVDLYDPQFHISSGFDRLGNCKPRGSSTQRQEGERSNISSETQCCGMGINRMIYKVDKYDCCTDGTVAPTGACPVV